MKSPSFACITTAASAPTTQSAEREGEEGGN